MASVLKVDKLDPQSGTALELGTSGDTVTVPTGAGLTVTDEVKTNKVSPATGTAFSLGDSGDTFTVPSGATLDISASTLTPPATMPASSGINFTALNATNLGSGTVPTARLGTGTASSSTVLYGDQTYKAEPGGTNTPAFRAVASAGVNVDTATSTKFPFNKVDGTGTGNPSFLDGGAFDTSLYRWTPGTVGKYFVSAELTWYETGTATEFQVDILMNESDVVLRSTRDYESNYGTISCNGILNVENTSDYYEVRGYQNSGGTIHFAAYVYVHFEGFRLLE